MNLLKKFTLLSMVLASLALVTGCAENDAETAGEKIDEMATDAGNAIEDACEDVKEGMKAEDKDC
jgi:outer membrane murein-binding lipoprotein Lpp